MRQLHLKKSTILQALLCTLVAAEWAYAVHCNETIPYPRSHPLTSHSQRGDSEVANNSPDSCLRVAAAAERTPGESDANSPSRVPRGSQDRLQWTWMKGASTVRQLGVYGTKGESAPGNTPGARRGSASWTDTIGVLWLFGGYGSSGTAGYFNDLWKYEPTSGNWTWMKGPSTVGQVGTYGTQGVASPSNTPGARCDSASWTDSSGNLWLFGGIGWSATNMDVLNDLWKYDQATGNWTWMKGASTVRQLGVYGSLGVAAPGNTPGARRGATSWLDASGRLWLFGGIGYGASGSSGFLNDLWRFDPSTGNWTWLKGASTVNQSGVYGTRGAGASANRPGGRSYVVSWMDASGALWMFGGYGRDSVGESYTLNDLWKYDPASGIWTWMKGATTIFQSGVYGTQGEADPGNTPGSRRYAVSWADNTGALWLFGGNGCDSTENEGNLNDLWRYEISSGNWTWMTGAKFAGRSGTYGVQGVTAPSNTPGGRTYAVSCAGSSGALWLFGGEGFDSSGTAGLLNDLWKLEWVPPPTHTVTFLTDGTAGTTLTGLTPQVIEDGANCASVTANAPLSHHFVKWTKQGVDYSTNNPLTVTNVTADMTIQAVFAINQYTLSYAVDANGTIDGAALQTVNHGASGSEVTAIPATGYHFVEWSDGVAQNPRTDSNVTANRSVSAVFAINRYTLSYAADANGTIVGASPQTVDHGTSGLEVTAIPAIGYRFSEWSDGLTLNPRTDSNVMSNISVTAVFVIGQYTLTYTAGEYGSIDGLTTQTINHDASGSAVFAKASTGYHFTEWSDGSTENPRTDTHVTSNIEVAASFAVNQYTLTYTAEANGSIDGAASQTIDFGTSGSTVSAIASAGYHFVKWSDDSTENPRVDTHVTSNIDVTALFAINQYTLEYGAEAHGS
ncbi:MAG: kelch repeat-containing protein, partial [Candidatus Hydrogenedentales bacterium]